MVQLGQPYSLDSMKLLLWDCDDRSYSYYIEVSVNQRDWDIVCDRTRDPCRSWQMITFTRRPVVFIRIVGTHNTANEVFHCVHFEAPGSMNDKIMSPSPPRIDTARLDDETTDDNGDSHDRGNEANIELDQLQIRQNQLQGILDPFQVPLGGAAGGGGPPMLPLQGLGQGMGPRHEMAAGAVPRAVRSVRRDSDSPPLP